VQTIEAIRHMCDEAGMTTVQVSEALGKSRAYVGATLSRGSVPKADTLSQIAQACGYRLILESDTDRIQIDPSEE
jgi:transcriptional regulator with XRE-family HTH domain